jgi:hypothetical protein
MRRKRKTTTGTARRKTRAKRTTRRTTGSGKLGLQRKLAKKLRQAKLAEKRATMQVSALARKNKVMIEKMRRTIKQKMASKSRLAAKARTQLAKKHSQVVRKLRREHALAMKKMRKLLNRANKQTGRKVKGFFNRKKGLKHRARKIGQHKRKTHGRVRTSARRRRVSRANIRRAA